MRIRARSVRRWLTAAVMLLLTPAALPEGAALDPMDPSTCAYPLGLAAENGTFAVFSVGDDPEWAMIDGSFAHATKTQQTFVSVGGNLFAVYDGRWRIGDGGSRHNIQVKTWGERGWSVPTEYPSNPDVTNSTPIGNSINPRAAGFAGKLWVVFARESSHNFQTIGTPILLRARAADGAWGPDLEVTEPGWTSVNAQPDLLPVGDKLLIAWVSSEGATHGLDNSLKGRFFDGATFGPIFNISRPNDGFGEGAFTLATDGERVAAAWISVNVTSVSPSYVPKLTVFGGSAWLPEVDLWVENQSVSYVADVEFYKGLLYTVFDTNDPAISLQGDYDVFLRTADPQTLALSPLRPLTDPGNRGEDYGAEMAVYRDTLYLNWVSSDDVLTYGSDLDLVLTSFDGTAWSPARDATADEKWPDDHQRAQFFEHEGALHMGWIELYKPNGSTAKDQRIATLLVARGARWWDGLAATYEYVAPPQDGQNTTARVVVRNASGGVVASPWYSVVLANGSMARPEAPTGEFLVNHTHNASAIEPFTVRACGKPVPLSEAAAPPPAGNPVPGIGAIGLVALAGVAVALARVAAKAKHH